MTNVLLLLLLHYYVRSHSASLHNATNTLTHTCKLMLSIYRTFNPMRLLITLIPTPDITQLRSCNFVHIALSLLYLMLLHEYLDTSFDKEHYYLVPLCN